MNMVVTYNVSKIIDPLGTGAEILFLTENAEMLDDKQLTYILIDVFFYI